MHGHAQQHEGNRFLWKVGIYLPKSTASHFKIQ